MNNDIEFKEWSPQDNRFAVKTKAGFGSKLSNFLVKISGGLIKNENQANYAILVLIAIIFIISFVIFLNAL